MIEDHSALKKIHTFFWNRFYIDALYYRIFAYPAITLSEGLYEKIESGSINRLNYFISTLLKQVSKAAYERLELEGINAFNHSVARFFKQMSIVVYQKVELGGIDTLNYLAANAITSFCQRFRKTHSGVLSDNMLAVSVGIVFLLVLMFIFGGLIP